MTTEPLNQRQHQILQRARQEGFVSVEALTTAFAVTPQTIRRDIGLLCDQGFLQRYHGGASLAGSAANIAYGARQEILRGEKEAIGRLVAQHIPDGASLFINIGTTTEAVARALAGHRGLKVVTNNIHVAMTLCSAHDIEISLACGRVREDLAVVGESATEFIRQFKADFGIIGISGIDPDGTLLDFDAREVKVTQAIIENSRKIFLATDATKFGRAAMVKVGRLAQIDALFCDTPPPAPFPTLLKKEEVRLFVSGAS